jgi:hypothetical protein
LATFVLFASQVLAGAAKSPVKHLLLSAALAHKRQRLAKVRRTAATRAAADRQGAPALHTTSHPPCLHATVVTTLWLTLARAALRVRRRCAATRPRACAAHACARARAAAAAAPGGAVDALAVGPRPLCAHQEGPGAGQLQDTAQRQRAAGAARARVPALRPGARAGETAALLCLTYTCMYICFDF